MLTKVLISLLPEKQIYHLCNNLCTMHNYYNHQLNLATNQTSVLTWTRQALVVVDICWSLNNLRHNTNPVKLFLLHVSNKNISD